MSTYTLTINVEHTYSRKLRSNGFKLCFAKCINGRYSVVWDAVDFSPRENVISWTESYTLFELNDDNRGLVKNGRKQTSPNTMLLKPGQHVTLNTAGAFEPTETEDAAQPTSVSPGILRIVSQRAPTQVGISCQLAHRGRFLKPVLLDVELKRKSPLDIKPEPKIIVWFDSQAKQGDELDPEIVASAREVDFTKLATNEHQISFVPPPIPRVASGVWNEGILLQA